MGELPETDPAQSKFAVYSSRTAASLAPGIAPNLELGLLLLLVNERLGCHGLLLPFASEWELECVEKRFALGIVACGRDDGDVHSA